MTKQKKYLGISLLVAMGLMLAACGAGGTSSGAEAAQSASGSNSPSSPSESVAQEKAPEPFTAFETTDLMTGEARNQSLFADYDLTLINVWATFCGPCLSEMPDLGELSAEYAEQGVQVVGIVTDVLNADGTFSESQLETAREIVDKTGANYVHLLPSKDLDVVLRAITAVPTTIFVDKDGNMVGKAYLGARDADGWRAIIEEMRKEVA